MRWFHRKSAQERRDERAVSLKKYIDKLGYEVHVFDPIDHEERPGGTDRVYRVTTITLVERSER